MLIKTGKPWRQVITVCFLLCIVMLLSGYSGCGGEEDDNNPEGNHSIQITNRLDFGGATKIDIYLDGALRKSNLGYGSSTTISGVSSGTHKILVSASPGQGTLFDVSTTITASGYGGSISLWVDDDGIHKS